MRFNKRGQELSTNTLILIILGVLILVFLIVGFTIGWKKILPFVTPGNNVKELTDKCSLACNTNAKYDFCSAKKDVRLDEPVDRFSSTLKEFRATCFELTLLKDELGVEDCASFSCLDTNGDYEYSPEFKALGDARDSAKAGTSVPSSN